MTREQRQYDWNQRVLGYGIILLVLGVLAVGHSTAIPLYGGVALCLSGATMLWNSREERIQ